MKGFKLISEAEDSYHVQHEQSGKSFTLEKKGLHEKAHNIIKQMNCGGAVKMNNGGMMGSIEQTFGRGKGAPPPQQQAQPYGQNVQRTDEELMRQYNAAKSYGTIPPQIQRQYDLMMAQQRMQAQQPPPIQVAPPIQPLQQPTTLSGFADGGQIPPALAPTDPAAQVNQAVMNDVGSPSNIQMPVNDPELQRKRELYNTFVATEAAPQNPSNPMLPNDSIDSMAYMFGKNGEAPQQFSSDAWNKAEQFVQSEKLNAEMASKQKEQDALSNYKKIESDNINREKAGLPPVALPQIPQMQMQQPQAQMPAQAGGPYQFASYGQEQQQSPMNQFLQSQSATMQAQQSDIANYMKEMGANNAQTQTAMQDYFSRMDRMETPEQIRGRYDKAGHELRDSLINNKIDPLRFVNNMSTGSKILASIGMMLGGAGAGRGGVNQAADTFNRLIERDIDAQKNDQSKTMNLFKMNREHMVDDMQATLATKTQMFSMLQAKIAMSGMQTQNAERKLNAANMIRQLQTQIDQNNLQLGILGGAKQGPGGLVQSDPSDYARMLGDRQQWTPETRKLVGHQIDKAKLLQRSKTKLIDAFDRAAKDVRSVSAVAGYKPGSIATLHQTLVPTFKDVEGTVNQSAMDNGLENMTPKWNDTPERIQERKKALMNYINSEEETSFARQMGVPLENFAATAKQHESPPMSPQNQQYIQYVQMNRGNPDPKVRARVQFLSQKLGLPGDFNTPTKKQAGF